MFVLLVMCFVILLTGTFNFVLVTGVSCSFFYDFSRITMSAFDIKCFGAY